MPPRASLRSGSRRYASSPCRSARCRVELSSSGSRRRAAARQSVSSADVARCTTRASPATGRRSSSPTAAGRSLEATWRHCASDRTEWSRSRPASQIGYQRRSASAVRSSALRPRPSCTRSRSRSLHGPASPRPTLPTAPSATPSACGRPAVASSQSSASRVVTRSVTAVRRAGPVRSARLRRVATSSRSAAEAPHPRQGWRGLRAVVLQVVLSRAPRDRLCRRHRLQRVRAVLAGADPGDVLDRDDPHLAVADLAGLRRLDDRPW